MTRCGCGLLSLLFDQTVTTENTRGPATSGWRRAADLLLAVFSPTAWRHLSASSKLVSLFIILGYRKCGPEDCCGCDTQHLQMIHSPQTVYLPQTYYYYMSLLHWKGICCQGCGGYSTRIGYRTAQLLYHLPGNSRDMSGKQQTARSVQPPPLAHTCGVDVAGTHLSHVLHTEQDRMSCLNWREFQGGSESGCGWYLSGLVLAEDFVKSGQGLWKSLDSQVILSVLLWGIGLVLFFGNPNNNFPRELFL